MTPVPFVDLRAEHAEIEQEVAEGIARVIERTAFVLGAEVDEFEEEFARFSGLPHCVAVGSGTDALELLVRAAGIGTGDEVLLPDNTFAATALAVVRAGARPVLVDVDPHHHLIDLDDAARRVGPRTKAILPVHLYGQMADTVACARFAREHGLVMIEDAAQAHGAMRDGEPPGALGLGAAYSFYPSKNLGGYGDGGAVVTRSDEAARAVRALRNYGSERKYHHVHLGFNSRLDTLNAVVLSAKLRRLPAWNAARAQAAGRYDEMLAEIPSVSPPAAHPSNLHVWHLYVVRVPRRDDVLDELAGLGVSAGVHYPIPLHRQPVFAPLGHAEHDFPVADTATREILSLPIFPHITEEQQRHVVQCLGKVLG